MAKRKKKRKRVEPNARDVAVLRAMVREARVESRRIGQDVNTITFSVESTPHMALLRAGLGKKIERLEDDGQRQKIALTHVQMWLGENGKRYE